MPERTCSVAGCSAPVRARGLCATDYNRQHQPNRHRKSTTQCAWCGAACLKSVDRKYSLRFCSLACRDARRADQRAQRLLPVLYVGELHAAQPPATPVAKPRRWTAGRCKRCRVAFVDRQPDARFCSTRCGRRYHRDQRKDEVPHATRLYVLERDGWRCQICMRGIPALLAVPHHKAGTVDHIVPRSQGGTHDPANLRAAHFICNTLRNNRGGNEQLALIG